MPGKVTRLSIKWSEAGSQSPVPSTWKCRARNESRSTTKDLIAWQKAIDLVTDIYKVTDGFPKKEVYSLTDQIRRAAVSVPSNISVEGQAHYSHREFLHFPRYSAGSLAEVETQLLIAERIGYIHNHATAPLVDRIHDVGEKNGS